MHICSYFEMTMKIIWYYRQNKKWNFLIAYNCLILPTELNLFSKLVYKEHIKCSFTMTWYLFIVFAYKDSCFEVIENFKYCIINTL